MFRVRALLALLGGIVTAIIGITSASAAPSYLAFATPVAAMRANTAPSDEVGQAVPADFNCSPTHSGTPKIVTISGQRYAYYYARIWTCSDPPDECRIEAELQVKPFRTI